MKDKYKIDDKVWELVEIGDFHAFGNPDNAVPIMMFDGWTNDYSSKTFFVHDFEQLLKEGRAVKIHASESK